MSIHVFDCADKKLLQNISNKNERRVMELLPAALKEFPKFEPESLDIQDIYALTLNKLKPRYKQKGTVVLREPITDELIMKRLKQAIRRVKKNPNHS